MNQSREKMNREDEETEMKEKRVTWGKKRHIEVRGKDQETEIEKQEENLPEGGTRKWNQRTSNTEASQENYKYSYHKCLENQVFKVFKLNDFYYRNNNSIQGNWSH